MSQHDQRRPAWHAIGPQIAARNKKQGMGVDRAGSSAGATSLRRMVPGDNDVEPTLPRPDPSTAPVRNAIGHRTPACPSDKPAR